MSEVVIPSTPNWFLNDCICVGRDGYIVYGTLSVGIGILAPSETEFLFRDLKTIHPAHKARVSCLHLCPEWITTRLFVSGSDDGTVKLWKADSLSSKIAHDVHVANKETVIGVTFLNNKLVVSVGSSGYVATWNVHTNTVQTNQKLLKGYKPVCTSVCPHKDNVVAAGTKQGVVIVFSVSGEYNETLKVLFKAPGHDSEITSLSWCPTPNCDYFDNLNAYPQLKKKLGPTKEKSLQPDVENKKKIEDNGVDLDNSKLKLKSSDEQISENVKKIPADFLAECNEVLTLIKSRGQKSDVKSKNKTNDSCADNQSSDEQPNEPSLSDVETEICDNDRTLDTTNDQTSLDDSDIFDMYKDISGEEWGHSTKNKNDIEILKDISSRPIIQARSKRKQIQQESKTIIEETSVDLDEITTKISAVDINEAPKNDSLAVNGTETKFLYLASCCKKGNLCVWRWGGMLMMSEEIKSISKNKFKKKVTHPFGAVLWLDPSNIIVAAKDSQLVCCSFTDKMKISHLHDAHKRGLFGIVSNITDEIEKSTIWTVSMDRLFAGYSFNDKTTSVYSTFGGFVYDLQISPIDSNIFAGGCGDGMIRVWRMVEDNGVIYMPVCIRQLWNGVNGKILSLAWHPNKENTLAFSTLEGKVGLLNTSGEGPAQILPFALPLGAFHICWGLPNFLFACGGETLIVYDTKANPIVPEKINVNDSDEEWKISSMCWNDKYLTVGSSKGGIGLLNPCKPFELKTSTYAHRKAITSIAWHPSAVTTDEDLSPWANLIAISAKATNIVVMRTFDMNGILMLETFRDFVAHTEYVTCVCWSPHHNGRLLSTSHDCTVQIWDVLSNTRLATFADHQDSALCAVWSTPFENHVISGSSDCSLRIWNINKHPPLENMKKKGKLKNKFTLAKTTKSNEVETENQIQNTRVSTQQNGFENTPDILDSEEGPNMATLNKNSKKKTHRKILPLAITWKQYKRSSVEGCRRLFKRIVDQKSSNAICNIDYSEGYDYLRIYGTHEEILELLSVEQSAHKETFYWDAWAVIGILKGDLKEILDVATEQSRLTPALLTLSPSISHRYWKEVLGKYVTQVEQDCFKITPDGTGLETLGKVWDALLLLCIGQVDEACLVLGGVGLEAEAICVARARHIDHIAEKHMELWAQEHLKNGAFHRAAECHLGLGQVMEAATVLGRSNNEEELWLSAEMAKYAGNAN